MSTTNKIKLHKYTDIQKLISENGTNNDIIVIKKYQRKNKNIPVIIEFTFVEDPVIPVSLKQSLFMDKENCTLVKTYEKKRSELNDMELRLIDKLAFIDPKNYIDI